MPESRLLTVLQGHCPYLKRLFYGPKRRDYTGRDPLTVDRNQKGVVSVHLGGDGSYDQGDLIQFLLQQRDTLEIIEFRVRLQRMTILFGIYKMEE